MEFEMEKNKLLIKSQVNEDTILTLFDNIKLIIPCTLSVEVSKNTIRIINQSKEPWQSQERLRDTVLSYSLPSSYEEGLKGNLGSLDEEWNLCGDVEPKHNMLSSFYICPQINKERNKPFHSFYPLDLNLNEEELNHSDSDSDLSSLKEEDIYMP